MGGARRTWPRLALLGVVFGIAVVAGSAARSPSEQDRDWLEEGRALCREGRWEDAIPPLNRHLLEYPDDAHRNAAAHFYLGQCYLLGEKPFLVVAEGEYKTALRCYHEGGATSPIPEFSDQYFELRCHLELAKVYLKLYQSAEAYGASAAVFEGLLDRLRETAREARKVDPESGDVLSLEDIIESLEEPPSAPPSAPEPAPRQPRPPRATREWSA